MEPQDLVMMFDGGSRGNPGHAGAGAHIFVAGRPSKVLWWGTTFLGSKVTNNVSEYEGMILGLRAALKYFGPTISLEVRGDSLLVVNQMAGMWQVNNPGMKQRHAQAQRLAKQFHEFRISHVLREQNGEADRLSNEAMDSMQDDEWLHPEWVGRRDTVEEALGAVGEEGSNGNSDEGSDDDLDLPLSDGVEAPAVPGDGPPPCADLHLTMRCSVTPGDDRWRSVTLLYQLQRDGRPARRAAPAITPVSHIAELGPGSEEGALQRAVLRGLQMAVCHWVQPTLRLRLCIEREGDQALGMETDTGGFASETETLLEEVAGQGGVVVFDDEPEVKGTRKAFWLHCETCGKESKVSLQNLMDQTPCPKCTRKVKEAPE